MVNYGKGYTEEEIIRGCIANDRRCQEFLYRAHFHVMMSMVRRFTSDEETALDIINSGFLRVFKKIEKYSGKGSFQGWIRRIVYHSISDHFRKEANYLRFIVLDEVEKPSQSGPLEQLYYEDLIDLVNALPRKSGEVFRLYAIEGYAHKEIADMLEISEGTSKWYLSKAREQLREQILNQSNKRQHAG